MSQNVVGSLLGLVLGGVIALAGVLVGAWLEGKQ
jgi:hypothetical protein